MTIHRAGKPSTPICPPQTRLAEFYTKPEPKADRKDDLLMEDEVEEVVDPITDYAYTVAAAQRSEQRRLVNYVKMSDYVVTSSLQTMLLKAMRELLKFTTPLRAARAAPAAAGDAKSGPNGGGEPKDKAQGRGATGRAALFALQLLFVNERDLIFEPSRGDFQHSVEQIVNGFVGTLCTVPR